MPATQLSLKGRALRLLSGREHSVAELQRKLAAFEEEPGQLAQVMEQLQARGFISEQRVADSVVHRRSARLGGARIRHELKGKGLTPALIAQAVEALRPSELVRAREVWLKKFGGKAALTTAERARQARFLAARGFAGEVIHAVMVAARNASILADSKENMPPQQDTLE